MKKRFFSLFLLFFTACSIFAQNPPKPLFKSVPKSETGINFANMLKESPELNIIAYEYFYNGGGVGLGDFNNDGLIDIYFSGNLQPAKLYLNKGNFKFEDSSCKTMLYRTQNEYNKNLIEENVDIAKKFESIIDYHIKENF
jgi:hypothetical protein